MAIHVWKKMCDNTQVTVAHVWQLLMCGGVIHVYPLHVERTIHLWELFTCGQGGHSLVKGTSMSTFHM